MKALQERPYFFIVSSILFLFWFWSALQPIQMQDWLLENSIVFAILPILLYVLYYIRLSNFSVTLVALFLVLHFIGAHYTYGDVPFGYWLQTVFHTSKNVYDRFVHFSFGFLMYYPIRELFLRVSQPKGFWSFYIPFDVVISFSALYEIFEWLVYVNANPRIGLLFIGGTDVTDTPKDMACAAVGALIAAILLMLIKAEFTTHFWQRIKNSFKLNRAVILEEDLFLHRFFSRK